jgi:creatinase
MDRPRLLTIRNGEKVKPTFSRAEMTARNERLRKYMVDQDIAAALFTSVHNVNYFADYVYTYFGRNYGLVVTEQKHVTISANVDFGQPYRQSFGENIAYTDWHKDNFFEAVKTLVPNRGRVGIEFDHVTIQNRKKLGEALPAVEFIDISEPVMAMRMIKSKEEQDIARSGAAISDIGGAAAREAIADGVPEYEVALAATQAMVREIAKRFPHTELMDTWSWIQTGPNTDGAHNPVTSRQIHKGDIISINCFSMISGYYQALERTMFLDSATERQLEVWELNCRVHRKGCELIRPGAVCKDIANELNEIYIEHDLLKYRTFGYGHSFGTLCHYYGREAGLELREDVNTVLEPGMVLSMEPMVTIPDGQDGAGGYREHDMLIVNESGAENVTKFPLGPEYNIVRG